MVAGELRQETSNFCQLCVRNNWITCACQHVTFLQVSECVRSGYHKVGIRNEMRTLQ